MAKTLAGAALGQWGRLIHVDDDTDPALIINQEGSGRLQEWQLAGVIVAAIENDGTFTVTGGIAIDLQDDDMIAWGTDDDFVIAHTAAGVGANTALAGAIIGTPVTPATAANSMILSTVTASADVMMAGRRGANSEAFLFYDSSAGDLYLMARGVAFLTLAGGGALTVSPATNVILPDNIGLAFGTAAGESTISSDGTNTVWTIASGGVNITGGVVTLDNTGLHLLDTNASHDLIIAPGSNLTGDHTLTLTTGDADRTLTLSGNPTLNDWFDQSVKTSAGPQFATIELGHATDTTLARVSAGVVSIEGVSILTVAGGALTGNLILNDNVTLGFGTAAGESTIKSDGSDTIWQMAQGGLTIGLAASAPSPDQNVVHIWKATAGNVTANANSLLTLEGGTVALHFLSATTSWAGIISGDSADDDLYWLLFYNSSHATLPNVAELKVGGIIRLRYSAGAFAFQEATTISTTVTTLTLSPTTDVHISDGKGLVIGHTAQVTVFGSLPELQIVGTAGVDAMLAMVNYAANTQGARLFLGKSRDATIGTVSTALSSGDELGSIIFVGSDTVSMDRAAQILITADAAWSSATDRPTRFSFWVTPDASGTLTEAVRFTSGQVITTLGAAPANVTAAGAGIFKGGIAFTDVLNAWIDDATHGDGTTTLYVGNQTITTASDIRVKRDIAPTVLNAMSIFRRLQVRDYAWNDPTDTAPVNRNSRGRWTGLIAQEAIDLLPWVFNAPDRTCRACRSGLQCHDHKSLWFAQYDQMAGLFVKGFQEVDDEVTIIKKQITDLEGRLKELERVK